MDFSEYEKVVNHCRLLIAAEAARTVLECAPDWALSQEGRDDLENLAAKYPKPDTPMYRLD